MTLAPVLVDHIVLIHVLGWVFWLGTDLGVFLAAKYSERADLSVETRLTILEVGMILDSVPRLMVPIVFTTGVVLMHASGYPILPLGLSVVLGGIWLAVAVTLMTVKNQGPLARPLMYVQFGFYALVITVLGGGALWGLSTDALPLWLALKGIAYTLVAVGAIGLEIKFGPAVATYGKLAAEGASDQLNADLTRQLRPVYRFVLLIYAGTFLAGYAGVIKPGI